LLIFWDQARHRRLDESGLFVVEKEVGRSLLRGVSFRTGSRLWRRVVLRQLFLLRKPRAIARSTNRRHPECARCFDDRPARDIDHKRHPKSNWAASSPFLTNRQTPWR
jgi:hypothetical protein